MYSDKEIRREISKANEVFLSDKKRKFHLLNSIAMSLYNLQKLEWGRKREKIQ